MMKNMNLNTGFDASNENRMVFFAGAPESGPGGPRPVEDQIDLDAPLDLDGSLAAQEAALKEAAGTSFNKITEKQAKLLYPQEETKISEETKEEIGENPDMSAGEKMLEDPDNPHYQEGTPLAERSGAVSDDTMEARTDEPEPTHKEQLEKFTGVVDLEGRVVPEKEDKSTAVDTGERVDAPTSTARPEDEQVEQVKTEDPLGGLEK